MPVPQKTREYRLPKVDGFHNLTLQEAAIPKLQATEVLVKVHAVSLQGTIRSARRRTLSQARTWGGSIVAVGEDVKCWKVGDHVTSSFYTDDVCGEINGKTCLGGPIDSVLTEYRILPAPALVRIPEHLSYDEASTLPCAAFTAYNAFFGPKPLKGGDIVLVQGTGSLSIFGLQIAVASVATVIATSPSDEKLQVAKKLGAAHAINYKKTPDWDKEVLNITGGRGVDHVIEVGGPGTILKTECGAVWRVDSPSRVHRWSERACQSQM